ncbi:hypothetical protein WHR41_01643 [Cladosporium halotolerans]|uniref:Glyoxalase-like domain-containing protein n=1 Tax=Cladosporium halotolerans TaxID=1052096 RepID=A0AB34KZ13_9PEZI
MPAPRPLLDHIILLVPHAHLTQPPSWLSAPFTLSPGGRHADNRTDNRLILLPDGVYLELIAFVNDDPQRRAGHWWDKPCGVVDWALTLAAPEAEEDGDLAGVNERLESAGSGVRYDVPIKGGRTRPDGVEMEWRVGFPRGVARGVVPFWCFDVTERERRVPVPGPGMEHACGAVGVEGVRVRVAEGRVKEVREAVGAVLGREGDGVGRVRVGVPRGGREAWVEVAGLEEGESDGLKLEVVVRVNGSGEAPRDIRERIGEGEVVIRFQKA